MGPGDGPLLYFGEGFGLETFELGCGSSGGLLVVVVEEEVVSQRDLRWETEEEEEVEGL